MNNKKSSFLCALLFIITSVGIAQSTYYVSTNGTNSNPGTLAQPFSTIQYAVNTATAGSTVYVMGGTYVENITMNTHSGTPSSPIIFENYNNEEVIIDGGGTSASNGEAIWSLTNVDHITIDGFIFKNIMNLFVKGLVINNNCNYITVTNSVFTEIHFSDDPYETVEFSENASPIIVYSTSATNPVTNIVFSNNEVFNCRTGYSEGMSLSGNVDGFTLDSNYVHDITNIGIHAEGHFGTCPDPQFDQVRNGVIKNNIVHDCNSEVATAGLIYVDGGKNIIIENNEVYNGQVGFSVGCENTGKTAENITVRNNIVHHNSITGIEIGGYDYPSNSGTVINSSVLGNTFYKNDTGNNWIGEMWVNHNENLTAKNNIFYADNSHKIIYYYSENNGSNNQIDYNVFNSPTGANDSEFTYDGVGYYSFSEYISASNKDTHSLFDDPQFVNAAESDFHLMESSPAINAGDPNYIAASNEMDMDEESRVIEIINCGADENGMVLGTQEITQQQKSLKFYPNPTRGEINIPDALQSAAYKIVSITGAIVKTGSVNNSKIDLSGLPTSLYIVVIQDNETNESHAIKVIKQ